MVKQFLITRPRHDKRTFYIHSFSKGIVAIAKDNGNIHMTELEGPKATRKKFESYTEKNKPSLIFLNGHGDEISVLGHENKPILDQKNIKIVKGKIVYALACESLVKLGPLAVEKGAKAYIGYNDEFQWVVDLSRTSSPDKDKNAAPFRKACFVLGKNLLEGIPVGKCIERTKHEYKRLIRTYGTSEDNYGDSPLIGLALSWNLMFLGMTGDPEAAF